MANIAIFKPNQIPQYLTSVNTPDYSSDPDVLVNPDISALKNIPLKYWKRERNNVVEMTQVEKLVGDNAEKQVQIDAINAFQFEASELAEILVTKGILTKIEIVNLIRQRRGL